MGQPSNTPEEEENQSFLDKILNDPLKLAGAITGVSVTIVLIYFLIVYLYTQPHVPEGIHPPSKNVLDFSKSIIKQVNDSEATYPGYFNRYKIADTSHTNLETYSNKNDIRDFVQGADGKFYRNLKI